MTAYEDYAYLLYFNFDYFPKQQCGNVASASEKGDSAPPVPDNRGKTKNTLRLSGAGLPILPPDVLNDQDEYLVLLRRLRLLTQPYLYVED